MFSGNEHDDNQTMESHVDITDPNVEVNKGKEKRISPYKVAPITDQDKIDQLFSKNGDTGAFFVTVACKEKETQISMIAPYCTPTMYYVCYKCGMASQEGRSVETHIKTCVTTNNKKSNTNRKDTEKKIKVDRIFSKKVPRFGWYNGERYLVIEECPYAFSCVCGAAFNSVRSLQVHFKKCPYTENIFPMVGSGCENLDESNQKDQ